jgi:glycosyltransferase involved in cell wall biosynthesis
MTVQLQDRAESGLLPVVTILLATYNGERYLREQIDSLLAQTHPVRVLARDDGSRDGTVSILRDYAERWPQRFALLEDDSGTGHAKWNFLRLTDTAVQIPGIDYLAFADQDDVWMPEKIELEMKAMRQLEKRYGATVPLLVFSDLSVVDASLGMLHCSFWEDQRIDPRKIHRLRRLLAQNVVTGCTSVLNRPLAAMSLRMPPEAIMHDWWVALLASAQGHAAFVREPLVLYRQHGNRWVRVLSWIAGGYFLNSWRASLAILWYLWDMDAAKSQDA